MDRRRLLATAAGLCSLPIAGCADDEPDDTDSDGGVEDDRPTHARSGAGVLWRIDPPRPRRRRRVAVLHRGGARRRCGAGLLGSFPTETTVASTLVDPGTRDEPAIVHELDAASLCTAVPSGSDGSARPLGSNHPLGSVAT